MKGIYGREMYETWYQMSVMIDAGLDISPVITHRFPFTGFEEAFAVAASGDAGKVAPRLEGGLGAPSGNALQIRRARAAPGVVFCRPDTSWYRDSLRPSLACSSHSRGEAALPEGTPRMYGALRDDLTARLTELTDEGLLKREPS